MGCAPFFTEASFIEWESVWRSSTRKYRSWNKRLLKVENYSGLKCHWLYIYTSENISCFHSVSMLNIKAREKRSDVGGNHGCMRIVYIKVISANCTVFYVKCSLTDTREQASSWQEYGVQCWLICNLAQDEYVVQIRLLLLSLLSFLILALVTPDNAAVSV